MKRTTLIPLLTPLGTVLLGATLLPLVASLGNMLSFETAALMSAVLMTLWVGVAGNEWVGARVLVGATRFTVSAPSVAYSGRPYSLELETLSEASARGVTMRVMVELPLHSTAEPESGNMPAGGHSLVAPLTFLITPFARGAHSITAVWLRLERKCALLTLQCRVTLDTACSLVVYPNASFRGDAPVLSAAGVGTRVFEWAGGEGREFDSLRRYAVGDDLRRVDWKRSARGTLLLVRSYRPETHQRVCIAIDCSRRMAVRLGKRLQLDYAADAAAFLTVAASANDDEVGMVAFNHELICEHKCARGKRQERTVIESLAALTPASLEADYTLLTEWGRRVTRRSLLVVLTSAATPRSFEVLYQALRPLTRRHQLLVIAISDPELEARRTQVAQSLDDAYIIAATSEQLDAIHSRIAVMERAGIECGYCDARTLSSVLHQKYLKLKMSGRL